MITIEMNKKITPNTMTINLKIDKERNKRWFPKGVNYLRTFFMVFCTQCHFIKEIELGYGKVKNPKIFIKSSNKIGRKCHHDWDVVDDVNFKDIKTWIHLEISFWNKCRTEYIYFIDKITINEKLLPKI